MKYSGINLNIILNNNVRPNPKFKQNSKIPILNG